MPYQPLKEEPTRYLFRLLEVVEEAGVDAGPFLAGHDLTREQVADPQGRITYAQYLGVIEELLDNTDIPGLSLQAGLRTPVIDHGILGYAFISSANLLKAMEIFSRYQKLQGPLVNVYLRREGDDAVYTSERAIDHMDARMYCFAVEGWIAEASRFRELFEKPLTFNVAWFNYPEPAWADLYRELLDCEMHFGADRNEIRFPGEFLDMPFSLAEPSVAELCARQCEEMLRQMDAQPDVVDDVRRVLLNQPGAMPGLDEVAHQLHMSPRTLRRRLYDAETSFREIVADVRMKLAKEYLSSTALPTAEIAFLLGYSDVTAFHRSFKKLHDTTPAAYREAAHQQLGWGAGATVN